MIGCVALYRKSWHMKVKKLSFSSDKKDSGSRGGSLDRDSQSDMKVTLPEIVASQYI